MQEIITLTIAILFLVAILVLLAKLEVKNEEMYSKDASINQWEKDYLELYDKSVNDISELKEKLIIKENQIDKLEEVIHNLEKNK